MKEAHTTLEALYLAHKDHVHNYVYRLCGDADVAQDVVQQTFLKLLNDPNLASLSHPRAYLFTVARNTLYDGWRKKREARLDEHEEQKHADMSSTGADEPGEQVAEAQLRDRIDRYLASMPEKSRELMVLRYVEDLSIREIAHVTSRTVSDVKVGLYRARHRFDAGFTRHMYARVAASRAQCEELGRLIEPWGDKDIPVAQLQLIEAHIDACRICRDDADDMKRMRKLFAALPLVGVPLALDATLREAVAAPAAAVTAGSGAGSGAATATASTSAASTGAGTKIAVGVVAAALLGGGGLWLASRPGPAPEPEAVVAPPALAPGMLGAGETAAGESVPVQASARLTRQGPVVTRPLAWEVHRLSESGGPAEFVTSATTAQARFSLPPGRYRISVRDGEARASRRISVTGADPLGVELVLEAGSLRVGARLAAGQPLTRESVRFEVHEADPDPDGSYPFVAHASPARPLSLPPGIYRLEASLGLNARTSREFVVRPGEQTVLDDIVLDAGYLNLTARLRPGGPAITDNLRFEIRAAKPDVNGSHAFIGYAPNGRNVILRAGRYRIVSYWGVNTRTVSEVEVRAGERSLRDDIILPGGYLKLGARLKPGAPPLTDRLRLEIYAAKPRADGTYAFVTYAQPNRPIQLAAGRYRVAAHFGLNAGAATEVTVRAGELTANEDIIVNGGYLRVLASRNGQPLKGSSLRLEVYDAEMDIRGQRQFVTYVQAGGRGAGLARGSYYVKATYQGQSVADTVTVVPGETATLRLEFGS